MTPSESTVDPVVRWTGWAILALGVALRMRDFLLVRSLWLDEVMLARNLVDRSAAGLLRPLDHQQAAPVGFLLLQKLVITVLGPEDWAFRLLPLLASIGSLFLFAALSRQIVTPVAGLMGLLLLACNPWCILSTDKQYPVEQLVGLVLLALTWRTIPAARPRDSFILAAAGAGLVWVSHAAPLMLAACGATMFLTQVLAGRRVPAWWSFLTITAWLISFAANYALATRHLHASSFLNAYWRSGFAPRNAGPLDHVAWMGQAVVDWFRLPGKFQSTGLALGLATVGAVRSISKPTRFGLLVGPILVTLAVADAGLFPFTGRMLIFLLPVQCLLIVIGLELLMQRTARAPRAVGYAATVVLVWRACLDARTHLLWPMRWQEPRQVISAVAERAHPGDLLYVHPNAAHAFAFYGRGSAFAGMTIVHAVPFDLPESAGQIRTLPAGSRVWLIYLDMPDGASRIRPPPREYVVSVLAERRNQLEEVSAPGASALLFSAARER
jgi:hypothetical protein